MKMEEGETRKKYDLERKMGKGETRKEDKGEKEGMGKRRECIWKRGRGRDEEKRLGEEKGG